MLPAAIEHIRRSAVQVDARLIVVDPISAYSACNLSSDQSARKALGPLTQLAKEMNAAVILVRHFTKGSRGQNSLYQGAGSIGIIGLARSALQVIDDPNNAGCRLLVHTKCSVGPKAKTIRFRPQQINGRLGIEWIERIDFPGNTVESSDGLGNSPALEEAVDYLYRYLCMDPRTSAKLVKDCARDQGISKTTLERAKKWLGVRSIREGFGVGSCVYWVLVTENPRVQELEVRYRPEREADD
jgi:DNA repair protein RadA/Sms